MKWKARHFWRWLLHTPLTVSSSPRASHVAENHQLLLIVFEFLHNSSRRHPPTDINKHKQQNQESLFETGYRHFWRWLPKQPLQFYIINGPQRYSQFMESISYLVINTSIGIMYVTSCQCTNRQRCIFNWTTRLQRLLCASQKTTSIFCGHGTKNLCSTGAQISLTSTCHLCSFPYHLSLSPLPPSPKTHTRPLTNPVQEHDVQNVNCK